MITKTTVNRPSGDFVRKFGDLKIGDKFLFGFDACLGVKVEHFRCYDGEQHNAIIFVNGITVCMDDNSVVVPVNVVVSTEYIGSGNQEIHKEKEGYEEWALAKNG